MSSQPSISESQELLLRQAIDKWGAESQIEMSIEECAEYTVAAQKLKRVGGRDIKPEAKGNVIDEIADVFVMMHQMAIIHGSEAVQDRINFKIQRLAGRLERP